jgi:hypothetical protein
VRSGKLFRLEVLASKRIKHKFPAVCHRLQTTNADLQATDRDALVQHRPKDALLIAGDYGHPSSRRVGGQV